MSRLWKNLSGSSSKKELIEIVSWSKMMRDDESKVTQDEMAGWHHQLNRHEFEQTLGNSEGQGRLVCCSLWGCKEPDTTEQLNNNLEQGHAILFFIKPYYSI